MTLTASADSGQQLSAWAGGGCYGSNATCSLTMDADKTIGALFALAGPPGPYVILKWDDFGCEYPNIWPQGSEALETVIKPLNVKVSIGFFTEDLTPLTGQCVTGHPDYMQYIHDLAADPRFEIWYHAYVGIEWEFGCEWSCPTQPPLAPSPSSGAIESMFSQGRFNLLYHLDFLPRVYGPHWYTYGSNLFTAFNTDPYFHMWFVNEASDQNITKWLLDANSMNCVNMEDGNGEVSPGAVELPATFSDQVSQFVKGNCVTKDVVVLQTHPGQWYGNATATSYFIQNVGTLKQHGARFVTAHEYYNIKKGYTDTVRPTIPSGLTAGRVADSDTVYLSWDPSNAPSGVDAYKVYKNGTFLNLTQATSYSDSQATSDTDYYEVAAVSVANLSSARSAPVSVVPVTETCAQLGGQCCKGNETCKGTLQASADCAGLCCVGGQCEAPQPTCANQGYVCCVACQAGPHSNLDGTCSAGVCCDACEVPQPDAGPVIAPDAALVETDAAAAGDDAAVVVQDAAAKTDAQELRDAAARADATERADATASDKDAALAPPDASLARLDGAAEALDAAAARADATPPTSSDAASNLQVGAGCSCATTSGDLGVLVALFALGLVTRRRR